MISAGLAMILRSARADFNARFAAARRIYPELQPGAFADFLRTGVDELACAIESVRADRLGEVTMTAYDAALELVGQKLAGPGARFSSVEEGWRRILPKIAPLVAGAPGRLIPALCNAVYQLAATPEARPGQWIEIMEKLGPQCADAEAFLKLGQVVAWRAGLAHFRQGALALADGLPEKLVLAALGASADSNWPKARAQLLANPWFDPGNDVHHSSTIRIAAQVGAFRGFGGLFVEPPLIVSAGGHFLARSDSDCWLLTTDAFGSTFHRASIQEFETAARARRLPTGLKITGSRIAFNGEKCELPALGDFTSAAANETTVAVTSRFTHAIVLLALR